MHAGLRWLCCDNQWSSLPLLAQETAESSIQVYTIYIYIAQCTSVAGMCVYLCLSSICSLRLHTASHDRSGVCVTVADAAGNGAVHSNGTSHAPAEVDTMPVLTRLAASPACRQPAQQHLRSFEGSV